MAQAPARSPTGRRRRLLEGVGGRPASVGERWRWGDGVGGRQRVGEAGCKDEANVLIGARCPIVDRRAPSEVRAKVGIREAVTEAAARPFRFPSRRAQQSSCIHQ